MRRTQSRKACHRGCHACGRSCEAAEERTVYSIVPPADGQKHWKPHSPEQGKRPPEWMASGGWTYARLMKNDAPTDLPEIPVRGSWGAARQASLHPKSGWKTTPARHRLAGGQDRRYALVKILNTQSIENAMRGSHTGSDPGENQHDTGRTGLGLGTH